MALTITIRPYPTYTTAAVSGADIYINKGNGTLNQINDAAQYALIVASINSLKYPLSPTAFIATWEASNLAFATSTAMLIQDINDGKPLTDKLSDITTMLGALTTKIGATAAFVPGGQVLAEQIDALGIALTAIGVSVKNSDSISTAWEELKTEIGEKIDSIKATLSTDLADATDAVKAAYNSAKTSLLDTIDKVSNVISDVGTSAFDASVKLASDAFNSADIALTSFFNSTGEVAENISISVIDTAVTIMNSASEVVAYFSTLTDTLSDTISAAYWKFLDALAASLIDPLIIDTAGNGIALDSWQKSNVLFDLNGNGTKENTGWTKANSDDSFLVIDKNNDGKINDITEMTTPALVAGSGAKTSDGVCHSRPRNKCGVTIMDEATNDNYIITEANLTINVA